MICIGDLQQLINSWQERADSHLQPFSYRDGVMDCIYELNNLIDKTLIDEATEQDAVRQMTEDAAEYLSNLEPEDYYATAI